MTETSSAVTTLERITREATFTDEDAAQRYLEEQAAEGFAPSPWAAYGGIVPGHHHHADGSESHTWQACVEKQTYNGVVTPIYHEGDRVHASVVGVPGWEPVDGTVISVRGHSLKVLLDYPNPNRTRELSCQDYEVSPIV